MKLSVAAVLLAIAGADAYSQPSRSTLRSLGQKTVSVQSPSPVVGASIKMEGVCNCCLCRVLFKNIYRWKSSLLP
jgi:hypothetical protein